MIDLQKTIESNVKVSGLVHVGAHEGQELNYYNQLENVHLIEPIPKLVQKLKRKTHHTIHPILAWDKEDRITFYVTKFDQGSSALKPVEHEIDHEITVDAKPLKDIVDNVNVAVIDTQGSELRVLKGMNLLPIEMIVVEVSKRARYVDAPTKENVVEYLNSQGFLMIEAHPHSEDGIIEDLVFIKSRRVIIAAGGEGTRWNNYLGVSKHNIRIGGETLLERTKRLFRWVGDEPIVILEGKKKFGDLDKIWSSRDYWNKYGRTVIVFGDVYFTDEAVLRISDYTESGFTVFGRIEPSVFSGKKYGELFAVSFYPEDIPKIEKAIERVTRLNERGVVDSVNLWSLYRAIHNFPDDLMNNHFGGDGIVIVHDKTEDFDWPDDYNLWMKNNA